MTDIERLAAAVHYAAGIHTDQRRKGERAEPYINHLAEVADLVAKATGGQDVDLVIAAYLHDAIEDQGVTRPGLAAQFGDDVAGLVAEVSEGRRLERELRKARQIECAADCTPRAQILKLADKCANLSSLLYSPPAWPRERKVDYFEWAWALVERCRGANAYLEAHFDALYAHKGELL